MGMTNWPKWYRTSLFNLTTTYTYMTPPNPTAPVFTSPPNPLTAQMQALQAAYTKIAANLMNMPTTNAANLLWPTLYPPPMTKDIPEEWEPLWSPEPIEGWRTWGLNPQRGLLVPTTMDPIPDDDYYTGFSEAERRKYFIWETDHAEAVCADFGCTTVPGRDHPFPGCGLYALKGDWANMVMPPFRDRFRAAGKVLLTGTIIEYEKGYRAQKAQITDLYLHGDTPYQVYAKLVRRYPNVTMYMTDVDGKEYKVHGPRKALEDH